VHEGEGSRAALYEARGVPEQDYVLGPPNRPEHRLDTQQPRQGRDNRRETTTVPRSRDAADRVTLGLLILAAPIPLTAEQTRALIDSIASADTIEALADLSRLARREHMLDVRAGFLDLLIALRYDLLTRARETRDKVS